MAIRLSQLPHLQPIAKVIIHSIDLSMYQVSILIDGQEHYIADNKGKLLRTFNILDMQKLMKPYAYQEIVLRHESAYDEMIGQAPTTPGNNRLEVPLGDNNLN